MVNFKRQLTSTVALTAITVNLLFWIPLSDMLALFKTIFREPHLEGWRDIIVDKIYRVAVHFDQPGTWLALSWHEQDKLITQGRTRDEGYT